MMLACWMCSFPGFPWAVQFEHPEHVYYAWAIVIVAVILVILPFVLGYRLGPRMPYSVKHHAVLFLLFGVILAEMTTGLMSFGGSLALFLNWGDLLLVYLFGNVFAAVASIFGNKAFAIKIAGLWGIIAGHAFYTWIITSIDRPLIKPEKTKPERDSKNGQTD